MSCASCRSNSGICSNAITYLRNYRKQAATLYNTSKDTLEREELSALIAEIDDLIATTPTVCPQQDKLDLIKTYISSEYSKRIR